MNAPLTPTRQPSIATVAVAAVTTITGSRGSRAAISNSAEAQPTVAQYWAILWLVRQ